MTDKLLPDQVQERATSLLQACRQHRIFIISSGCDLPPNAPLAGLDAFYRAVADPVD